MKQENISIDEMINYLNKINDEFFDFLYTKDLCIKQNENVLLVWDDEYDAPTEINGYTYRLEYGVLKQICNNLQSQNPNPSIDDYIEAINYYIENDAFIDVENRDNKPQGGFKIWG